MFTIMSADEAVKLIKDNACIGLNAFHAVGNPEALHEALEKRISENAHPWNISIVCAAGFGTWENDTFVETYADSGAIKKVLCGHYSSMPVIEKCISQNKMEAYNMPMGTIAHCIRAAASGKDWYFTKVGLNTFIDPRLEGPALNEISKEEYVKYLLIDGEEYLAYKTPKIDVALLRGTKVDPNGNISFKKEYLTIDALAMAQTAKRNGGIVIVQVDEVSNNFERPINVVIPGMLVDVVVVSNEKQLAAREKTYNPSLSGDIHVPLSHMNYWLNKITESKPIKNKKKEEYSEIIAKRAVKEIKPGDNVNIGIGIPGAVGKYAAKTGLIKDLNLTVESGGVGGLPAPGTSFGATIGADMLCSMSSQFDFYEGGGLDICFMGALEIDSHGNVNSHKIEGKLAGIGGFTNITVSTKKVVFCLSFTAKGLEVEEKQGKINIKREGKLTKIKKDVSSISFCAKNALERGQEVIYVTERCVFKLTESGLKLIEVFPGIREKEDIRDILDFEV